MDELSLLAMLIANPDDRIIYNGHIQLGFKCTLKPERWKPLKEELERYFGKEVIVTVDEFGGDMYLKDKWGEGEHPMGHRNQLLLVWGVGND